MDGWMDGRMDGWMDGWMGGSMDGWLGGRTDVRMDGRMGGWLDGRIPHSMSPIALEGCSSLGQLNFPWRTCQRIKKTKRRHGTIKEGLRRLVRINRNYGLNNQGW